MVPVRVRNHRAQRFPRVVCSVGVGPDSLRIPTGILRVAEEVNDVLREMFFDLSVARHGLKSTGGRIAVPIVLPTVADKDAAEFFDLSQEIGPLHATSS